MVIRRCSIRDLLVNLFFSQTFLMMSITLRKQLSSLLWVILEEFPSQQTLESRQLGYFLDNS